MFPLSIECSPTIILNVVVFPAPLGPRSPTQWLLFPFLRPRAWHCNLYAFEYTHGFRAKDMLLTASWSQPYFFETPLTTNARVPIWSASIALIFSASWTLWDPQLSPLSCMGNTPYICTKHNCRTQKTLSTERVWWQSQAWPAYQAMSWDLL